MGITVAVLLLFTRKNFNKKESPLSSKNLEKVNQLVKTFGIRGRKL